MYMKHCLWLAIPTLLLAADQKDDAVKEDLKKLQGAWTVVSAEFDGNKLGDDDVKKMEMVIKDDTYTFTAPDETYKGTFKIDPAKKPKAIDRKGTEGPDAGKSAQGIYEVDAETHKLCYAAIGEERPSKFTSENGGVLIVLKRKK
jgi:uncharacterized protein (TIGR03067 family)